MTRLQARYGQESVDSWLTITWTLPLLFVSVASKELRYHVSGLESTLAGNSISVDSKGG
jgi:hypothetical protein